MVSGPTGGVELITYQGEIVATVGARRFWLAPQIDALTDDDPRAMFVALMAAYALQIRDFPDLGPYSDERAERFARVVLMNDEEFAIADANALTDQVIAGHFGVPVEQVGKKRLDVRQSD